MLRTVPLSRQIPLAPQNFLDGVPAVCVRIQVRQMEPDLLHTMLQRVCDRHLGRVPFSIVSRGGVDFVLQGVDPRTQVLLVNGFADVSAAMMHTFHAHSAIIKPSLIQVEGVDGMQDADILLNRILSILRFRTQYSIRALATGRTLTIPFQEPDRGVLEEHFEAVRDVVLDHPMPRPAVKLQARVMHHPIEISTETPQNIRADAHTP